MSRVWPNNSKTRVDLPASRRTPDSLVQRRRCCDCETLQADRAAEKSGFAGFPERQVQNPLCVCEPGDLLLPDSLVSARPAGYSEQNFPAGLKRAAPNVLDLQRRL